MAKNQRTNHRNMHCHYRIYDSHIFLHITAVEYWSYNLIILSFPLISCLWVTLLIIAERYKLAKQRRKNEIIYNKCQTKADFEKY